MALVDLIYSLGEGRPASEGKRATGLAQFNTLRVALSRRDFRAASLAARRVGGRPARDEYVRKLLEAAA